MSAAYGICELRSLVRSFSFTDDSVTLTDKFDCSEDCEIVERLVSFIEPKVDGTNVTLDNTTVTVRGARDCTVSSINVRFGTLYLIDFIVETDEFTCTIK